MLAYWMGKYSWKQGRKNKMKKRIITLMALVLSVALVLCSCGTAGAKSKYVLFEIEGSGTFVVELMSEYAPKTVENFKTLVSEGLYDGLIFHRVIPGFVAQAGDPTATGEGGSRKTIKGEFSSNGFEKNTLKHERGVISMARTDDPDSASSQFFICFESAPFLDGEYAAFGKVVHGMEEVDKIGEGVMGENDKPLEDVVIKSAKLMTDKEFKKYEEGK